MTSVFIRDRREDTQRRGETVSRQGQRMELCCHKPRNTWSHQMLEEARDDFLLEP